MALYQLVFVALIAKVLCEEYVKVILGDSFTLRVKCDEEGTLSKHESPTSTRQVAEHRSGVWIPEESFKDRISQSSSVVFNRAVYTDSGIYVLKCGGRVVDIQVEVVLSSDALVTQGEAVSLPCYYLTTVGTCWSVRWSKDLKDVLRWSSCDNKSNWAADDRLSLSADWLSHGNLSLNLQKTQKDDEGVYSCNIQTNGRLPQKGNPAAVRLKVSERITDQITNTSPPPPPVAPTQRPSEAVGTPAAVGITAVVCLVIGAVAGCLLLKAYNSRCASRRPSEEPPGPEHDRVNGASEPLNPHQDTNGFPRHNDTQADSPV